MLLFFQSNLVKAPELNTGISHQVWLDSLKEALKAEMAHKAFWYLVAVRLSELFGVERNGELFLLLLLKTRVVTFPTSPLKKQRLPNPKTDVLADVQAEESINTVKKGKDSWCRQTHHYHSCFLWGILSHHPKQIENVAWWATEGNHCSD